MEEEERKYKYGQFGYGKYVYNPDDMGQIKSFLEEMVKEYLPGAKTEYFV